MPKPQIPFTPAYPSVLDALILSYAAFSDLNDYVEAVPESIDTVQMTAEKVLKKAYPSFIHLKKERENGNYAALINNLKNEVLPGVGFYTEDTGTLTDNEAIYKELCIKNAGRMAHVIERDFYSRPLHEREFIFARDCIFHYCQYRAQNAGRLLNHYVWKFWDSFITNCLIEYGADVNAKHNNASYSTLLQAVRWGSSPEIVRKLIEHGANYQGYQQHRHGVTYTLMLVAALDGGSEVLSVLVEKFPGEAGTTLHTLDTMLNEKSDNKYSCQFNNESRTLGSQPKEFYSCQDMIEGKIKLLRAMNDNLHIQQFKFNEKDKKDILMYVQQRLPQVNTIAECELLYSQHVSASYMQGEDKNNTTHYSPAKRKFIEMIQKRMYQIVKDHINNPCAMQDDLGEKALASPVFSVHHNYCGLSNKYRKTLEACMQKLSYSSSALSLR